MFDEDTQQLSATAIIAIMIIIACILLGGIFTVVALKTQHDVVNPQIRQNKIDDPNTTIANKADFHNKLGEIITADQNILTDLHMLHRYSPNDPNYDTTVNNLMGVEQIRAQAINAYNSEADNPDKGKDLDAWMPKHIDVSSIPASDAEAETFLQNEINTLQNSYNKGY